MARRKGYLYIEFDRKLIKDTISKQLRDNYKYLVSWLTYTIYNDIVVSTMYDPVWKGALHASWEIRVNGQHVDGGRPTPQLDRWRPGRIYPENKPIQENPENPYVQNYSSVTIVNAAYTPYHGQHYYANYVIGEKAENAVQMALAMLPSIYSDLAGRRGLFKFKRKR